MLQADNTWCHLVPLTPFSAIFARSSLHGAFLALSASATVFSIFFSHFLSISVFSLPHSFSLLYALHLAPFALAASLPLCLFTFALSRRISLSTFRCVLVVCNRALSFRALLCRWKGCSRSVKFSKPSVYGTSRDNLGNCVCAAQTLQHHVVATEDLWWHTLFGFPRRILVTSCGFWGTKQICFSFNSSRFASRRPGHGTSVLWLLGGGKFQSQHLSMQKEKRNTFEAFVKCNTKLEWIYKQDISRELQQEGGWKKVSGIQVTAITHGKKRTHFWPKFEHQKVEVQLWRWVKFCFLQMERKSFFLSWKVVRIICECVFYLGDSSVVVSGFGQNSVFQFSLGKVVVFWWCLLCQ